MESMNRSLETCEIIKSVLNSINVKHCKSISFENIGPQGNIVIIYNINTSERTTITNIKINDILSGINPKYFTHAYYTIDDSILELAIYNKDIEEKSESNIVTNDRETINNGNPIHTETVRINQVQQELPINFREIFSNVVSVVTPFLRDNLTASVRNNPGNLGGIEQLLGLSLPACPTPLSPEIFTNLIRCKITERSLNFGISKDCTICHVDFKVDDNVILLPCSHRFHDGEDCIKRWFCTNNTCPNCRAVVV